MTQSDRDKILQRASEYAAKRWPDMPIETIIMPSGEAVGFSYTISTSVGVVTVEDLFEEGDS